MRNVHRLHGYDADERSLGKGLGTKSYASHGEDLSPEFPSVVREEGDGGRVRISPELSLQLVGSFRSVPFSLAHVLLSWLD